ncbi:Yip1-domain-containing protein [Amniculicola lignicola CBS 123094]|uniref:Protein YIP n=1 Tax=Amniculicola lignicola CBS 123094 TaxID=1392246 RepID=A0A6A5X214_9PLEO|nr:Yip1-domain-containing protein [Amniculicola lignicola CBS 123094]
MANRGYDVVVDVDQEGDLGHTDLQEDLEFHSSNFDTTPNARGSKIQPDTSSSFLPTHNTSGPSGSGGSRKHYLWTLSFYAQAFDVDTNEVLRRCRATLFPRQNFLDVLEGNPDLYGPVWIATTVVVILFLTGTVSKWMSENKVEGGFKYDFKMLSEGAGLVYGYSAIVPVGLWGVLKWWGVESASLLEVACLYGYANLVWIPVAVICWSPVSSKWRSSLISIWKRERESGWLGIFANACGQS